MRGAASSIYRSPRRSWRRARGELLAFALYFFCAVMLILSRIGHGALDDMRERFVDLTVPVLEAASIPVIEARHLMLRARSYAELFGEIDRLKAENEQLKQWEWSAKLLERKNADLRALLNAVDEPALHFVSGSVIADARGPFLRSALINLGRDSGVRVGYELYEGPEPTVRFAPKPAVGHVGGLKNVSSYVARHLSAVPPCSMAPDDFVADDCRRR